MKLGPNRSRIFTTTDRGDTWTERASDVATVCYDEWCSVIAVDPVNENILYAGAAAALKRTLNGGATAADWVSISAGVHADQQDIVFDPRDSRRVFLANDGGVYRSTNRGDSWTFMSGYMQITQFYDIDISEKNRQVVAGGAQDSGVYYRDQFGSGAILVGRRDAGRHRSVDPWRLLLLFAERGARQSAPLTECRREPSGAGTRAAVSTHVRVRS